MKLLLVVAGLAIAAWLSQLWDERERRKNTTSAKHTWDAATETLCKQQRDKQLATPNYRELPNLSTLIARADRERQERTDRIAREVMKQVSKHHDEYLH